MGSDWQAGNRQKIHQTQGLVPVTREGRDCSECHYFAEKLDWCRLKLRKAAGRCEEERVKVSFVRNELRQEDAGRPKRLPHQD